MWMGGQRHAPAALPPGKKPLPIVQEDGRVPGPVWKGAENLVPTGIRSPDRSAGSESLYQLSYPSPHCTPKPTYLRYLNVYELSATIDCKFVAKVWSNLPGDVNLRS